MKIEIKNSNKGKEIEANESIERSVYHAKFDDEDRIIIIDGIGERAYILGCETDTVQSMVAEDAMEFYRKHGPITKIKKLKIEYEV